MNSLQPNLSYFNVPPLDVSHLEGHKIAYWWWGSQKAKRIVICVHGLTRQGRDFDVLARTLLNEYQKVGESVMIVCPDVVGRGKSDWLLNPMSYQPPTYAYGLKALLDELGEQTECETIDWIGTSMGGIIGMLVSGVDALKPKISVRRLVLNDVGPVVQWKFIERLKGYLGQGAQFESLDLGVQALRLIFNGFGPHTSDEWRSLSEPMLKEKGPNQWIFHYDNAIAEPIRQMTQESAAIAEKTMWSIYDQINCEVLLIKGENSDLMTDEDAKAMCSRGPKPTLYSVAGVGHAPTLVHHDELKILMNFIVN